VIRYKHVGPLTPETAKVLLAEANKL
jgi:hypothetical protein